MRPIAGRRGAAALDRGGFGGKMEVAQKEMSVTAEVLLLILLAAATLAATGIGALLVTAFGPLGWAMIALVVIAATLALRLAWARLAARSDWSREDLADDWRAG